MLLHESNSLQIVISFKILNDTTLDTHLDL
jgi:hypothetical protein